MPHGTLLIHRIGLSIAALPKASRRASVDRRARRAKSDGVDVEKLVRTLARLLRASSTLSAIIPIAIPATPAGAPWALSSRQTHACSPDRRPAGMRPYTRKTKCDHIFPSAAALAVTCDHISPERRHRRDPRRRGALAAPQCGAIRAALGPAGKKPPQAGEGTPRITRARRLGASAVRVGAPPSRRSVRLPIAEKRKEPQRTPKGAAPRPFGAYERNSIVQRSI